jgi:hypothetical protein
VRDGENSQVGGGGRLGSSEEWESGEGKVKDGDKGGSEDG